MTAGRGVIHEERHGRAFAESGGTLEMVQVWVNLPRELERTAPRYQDLTRERIPTVDLADGAGTARVIAGDLLGTRGPAETSSPVEVLDLRLVPGRRVGFELPDGYSAVVLVLRGALDLNGFEARASAELALLEQEGSLLELEARSDVRALLLAGAPLNEPVVGRGPFVMSNEGDLRQAFLDFQAGRFGEP